MSLKGKRIACFAGNNYEDLEIHYPLIRLGQEEGAQFILIGAQSGQEYKGKYGYPCKSDIEIGQAKTADFDALLIPGGFAPDFWRRDKVWVNFVKEMHEKKKPIAAICHGPWMLCSAKILKGVKMTSFVAIKDDCENAGADWVDEPVVEDKGIITSRHPKDLAVFCQAIIKSLH